MIILQLLLSWALIFLLQSIRLFIAFILSLNNITFLAHFINLSLSGK
jgi:hypothetical protein